MAPLPELKELSDAAVLVLTSRDDERSKVAALDAGAGTSTRGPVIERAARGVAAETQPCSTRPKNG